MTICYKNENIYCRIQGNTKLYKLKNYKPIYKYKYFSGNLKAMPTFHHLYGHDAQTPHIHGRAVLLPSHHLRGHPIGRAYHRAALVLLRADLRAEAKVRCATDDVFYKNNMMYIIIKNI